MYMMNAYVNSIHITMHCWSLRLDILDNISPELFSYYVISFPFTWQHGKYLVAHRELSLLRDSRGIHHFHVGFWHRRRPVLTTDDLHLHTTGLEGSGGGLMAVVGEMVMVMIGEGGRTGNMREKNRWNKNVKNCRFSILAYADWLVWLVLTFTIGVLRWLLGCRLKKELSWTVMGCLISTSFFYFPSINIVSNWQCVCALVPQLR